MKKVKNKKERKNYGFNFHVNMLFNVTKLI